MSGERDQNLEENEALALGRPKRKRKPIDRYRSEDFREKKKKKPLHIPEGNGIKLRDIKKVSSNLRKREIDAVLKNFHTILYGVKVKNKDLKRNILLFSGFLWGPQEEKRKEKNLERKVAECKKSQLLDFCSLLEMRNVKSENTKKEISQKLIAFLKHPHDDDEDEEDDIAETTDDSDLASANQMVNLPAGNDMDENAILEMMGELGGNVLPVVNDMDENAAMQMLEELGGNELPAVNDMDENAILEMIEELGGNEPAEINNAADDDNNNENIDQNMAAEANDASEDSDSDSDSDGYDDAFYIHWR